MHTIARQLIAAEVSTEDGSARAARAAVRVCDKLGRSLAGLAGTRGAQSLLRRAAALATKDVPWVAGVTVGADGSMALGAEAEAECRNKESAAGGVVLVTTVLELLATFIGEALTLRLVQQVWPRAALGGTEGST